MNFIRKKISRKITVLCLFIAILICVAVCINGYFQYRNSIYKDYQTFAYSIADVAISYVDGDTITKCLESDILSDEYVYMSENLYTIYKKSGISSIYIAIPDKNNLVNGNPTIKNLFDVHIMEATDETRAYYEIGVIDEIKVEHPEYVFDVFYTGELNDDYFVTESKFGYNSNAVLPVRNSLGSPVAILVVSVPMNDLQDTLNKFVINTVIITVAIIALFIGAFMGLLYHTITRPVRIISKEANKFAQSNAQISEKLQTIKQIDEIGNLADCVYKMETDINSYIDNITAITAEKERIGAELNVATHIQASMLPCIFPAFPNRTDFNIFASMKPAKEVGGDFYDFFLIDNDHLAVVMADVSGKGVPAALFMVIAKTLLKSTASTGLSVKEVLEKVNTQLCENNEAEMFVTVWMGILDLRNGLFTCANAGHEFPAIYRKGKCYELLHDKHGFVLAGLDGAKYREYTIQLEEGDKLFLYTDGVAEATDANNDLFGTERMLSALNSNVQASPEETLNLVMNSIDEFVGKAPQFDDITMLSLEYKNQKGQYDEGNNS